MAAAPFAAESTVPDDIGEWGLIRQAKPVERERRQSWQRT
jgi:hypothetical protein